MCEFIPRQLRCCIDTSFSRSIIPAIIISQVEPTFIMARGIFTRESSSKMYSQKIFALAQLAAEIPYSFICAVAFFLLVRLIPSPREHRLTSARS